MRYRFKRASRFNGSRNWQHNPRRMRVADVFRKKANLSNKRCKICGDLTQEGKLYCTDHVEHHPYIQSLLNKIEEKHYEEFEVSRLGEEGIDPDGDNVHDILMYLKIYGPRTVERLARDLIMETEILHHYINFLAGKGQVNLTRNKRKRTVVSLPKARRNPRRRKLRRYLPRTHYDY